MLAAASTMALLTLSCASGGGSAVCGNGRCESGEDRFTCPADCGAFCGNQVCEVGESTASCPGDCYCGNGTCDSGENSATCAADCSTSSCGDGTCGGSESTSSCPGDCYCGNGTCDSGETSTSCPADCTGGAYCGDDTCDVGETPSNCPEDCGTCGNGICDAAQGETTANCPDDCTGCTHTTCDLYPQCGCDDGMKCTLDSSSSRTCSTAGAINAGGLCTAEADCSKGAMCIGRTTSQGQCMAYCDTGVGCGGGAGSYCVGLIDANQAPIPGAAICTIHCSPSTNTGCPTGLACEIYQDSNTMDLFTDCHGDVGTVTEGGACDNASGLFCAPSHFCNEGTCYRWCDNTSQCTTPATCNTDAFGDPVVIGTTTYGVCL
jgi:hypothetical protein